MKPVNIIRHCLPLGVLLTSVMTLNAQTAKKEKIKISAGPEYFPELIYTDIPGAPKLSTPKLIMGENHPVMGEGNGWASPAFFDYNGDGKKDLIIGEFSSGVQNGGHNYGNLMRAYINEGAANNPKFSDDFEYVKGYDELSYGAPLSVYTWCCMAFTPRLVDLDADGQQDIVTGQYNPGFVTWFRGSKKGFLPAERLVEEGHAVNSVINATNHKLPSTDITGSNYWSYSAVAFMDVDGDGDYDMVTGGKALRISENTGGKNAPKFGKRELLLTVDGQPLKLFRTHEERDNEKDTSNFQPESGGYNIVPYVDDWNNDGLPDLLVTSNNAKSGTTAITYFEGVQNKGGLRFKHGAPLFTVKNAAKELPGSFPNICVADWNNDGIKDLILGLNVPVINGKYDTELAWSWEIDTKTLKMSPADYSSAFRKYIQDQLDQLKEYQQKNKLTSAQIRKQGRWPAEDCYEHFYVDKKYEKLSHKGYMYVMLGKKS